MSELHGSAIEAIHKTSVKPPNQEAVPKTKTAKHAKWIGWAKLVLAVIFLVVLVQWIKWEELIQSLMAARTGMLILAAVLLIPNILTQGFRWWYLLRRQTPGVPMKEIVASLMLGWTLGILTPGRVGQFARAFAVPSAPTLPTIGLTIVDKLFTLVWIVIAGAVGFFSFFTIPSTWTLVWIPIVLGILYLAMSPRTLNYLLQKLIRYLPFRDKIEKITSTLSILNTRDCIIAHIFSILMVITFFSQFVILISAFFPIGYLDGFRATAAVIFVKTALPITFGELGIGEAASIHFFGQFGVQKAAAFNASILLFAINLVIPSLVGLIFLPALKFSKKDKDTTQS